VPGRFLSWTTGFSLRRGVENLEAVLVQAADYVDIGQALELAGIRYAVEATVQYGSGVSGSVLGQDLSVTLSEGIGTGTSYDFINMTRYAYDSTLAGGAVTLGLGPSVDLPASPTIEFSGGVVTSLTFNHEIGQSYEDCVSRTGGYRWESVQISSPDSDSRLESPWRRKSTRPGHRMIFRKSRPGCLTERPPVGILAKLTLSGGAEIGVEGNFSGEIGWAYADPDPASVYAYIPSREISRLHAIRAALSMSGDILSDGGAAGGPLPWIASRLRAPARVFMDIDEPIPDVPSAGGTYSAQALIDLGPFVMAGYRTNYEYDGTLQVIGYHFLETGEYRALMYDSSAGAVRYYGNLSASWKVVGGVLHLGNSAIDYWEALPGSLESFIDGVANGTWVQVDVSGTYYPSVSGSSVPGDPGASIDLTPVFMPR
jgi:LysM repeat protein